jgi:hypothetical protein
MIKRTSKIPLLVYLCEILLLNTAEFLEGVPSPKFQLKVVTSLTLSVVVKLMVLPLQMAVSDAVKFAFTSTIFTTPKLVKSQPDAMLVTFNETLYEPGVLYK